MAGYSGDHSRMHYSDQRDDPRAFPVVEEELEVAVPRGLTNLGNSCFMNATLQALAYCPPLSHYFRCCTALYQPGLVPGKGGQPPAKARMTKAFAETLNQLLDGRNGGADVVRPSELLESVLELGPAFRRHEQQDAQELLRLMLDVLHEQLQRPLATPELHERNRLIARRWQLATAGEEWKDPDVVEYERASKAWREAQAKGLYSQPPRKPPARTTSVVAQLFEGELLSSVECLTCRHVSRTRDHCLDLSLPLPGQGGPVCVPVPAAGGKQNANPRQSLSSGAGGSSNDLAGSAGDVSSPPSKAARGGVGSSLFNRTGSIVGALNPFRNSHGGGERGGSGGGGGGGGKGDKPGLRDCLDAFFAVEHLQGDEQYKCEKCNSLQNCTKSLRLLHAPPILALQLKRFRAAGGLGKKAGDAVAFPLEGLDLRPYMAGPNPAESYVYDLAAVIVHHGSSLSSGHYTAYVKGWDAQRRPQWYHKDDANATPCAAEAVEKVEAYQLFYVRQRPQQRQQLCEQTVRAIHAQRDTLAVSASSSYGSDAYSYGGGTGAGGGGETCLLSRGWLASLMSAEDPGPPAMHDVLCRHCKVDPRRFGVAIGTSRHNPHLETAVRSAAGCCVAVPHRQWTELQRQFGGGGGGGGGGAGGVGGAGALAVGPEALRACPECAAEEEQAQRILAQEKAEITRLDSTSVQPGDVWFVIDSAWLTHWREYAITAQRSEPPGEVSNWRLLSQGRIKPNLLRVKDYRGVNSQVWMVFQRRYGGGPPICRHEINLYSAVVPPPPHVPADGPPV